MKIAVYYAQPKERDEQPKFKDELTMALGVINRISL